MCCLWTQVVQVPTCVRESSGCIEMPIERFLVCLCQLYQLIVQHLGWLVTIQDVARMLILVLLLLDIMSNPLVNRWLLKHLSWHVFIRLCRILQMLK